MRRLAVIAVALLWLGGCGGSEPSSQETAPPEPAVPDESQRACEVFELESVEGQRQMLETSTRERAIGIPVLLDAIVNGYTDGVTEAVKVPASDGLAEQFTELRILLREVRETAWNEALGDAFLTDLEAALTAIEAECSRAGADVELFPSFRDE